MACVSCAYPHLEMGASANGGRAASTANGGAAVSGGAPGSAQGGATETDQGGSSALGLGGAANSSARGGNGATGGAATNGGQPAGGSVAQGGTVPNGGSLGNGGAGAGGSLSNSGGVPVGGSVAKAGGATSISVGGSIVSGGANTGFGGIVSTTGGTLGAGGAPATCADVVATGSPTLIDDVTDGDANLPPNDGRSGFWYMYNDETVGAVETPPPWNATTQTGGFVGANGKACFSGTGFSTWGAGLGLHLNAAPNVAPCRYDASRFTGITFTLSGAITSGYFRFVVATVPTASVANGGTCPYSSGCDNHYGIDVQPTATTQTVRVPFSLLDVEPWGRDMGWYPKQITGFHWEVKVDYYNYYGPAVAVQFSDVCIDDLSFY